MCDACIEYAGFKWHKKPGNSYYQTRLLLHREVWKAAHGEIPPGFHVHHKDENIHNNELDNLELLSSSEHNRLHCRQKLDPHKEKAAIGSRVAREKNRAIRLKRQLVCVLCGSMYSSSAKRPARYCSTTCLEKLRSGAFFGDVRPCEQCGDYYRAKRRIQRYCSRACNAIACGNRIIVDRTLTCDQCKAEFVSARSNARFCSRPCALRFHDGNRFRGKIKQPAAGL